MRKLMVGFISLALAVGLVAVGPNGAAAAQLRPADTYTRVWTGVSAVKIANVGYYLTINMWQDNQNGWFHGQVTGFPAGWVGLYDRNYNLIAGTGASKNVQWTPDASGGGTPQNTLEICGQATPPSDNGVSGQEVCSGVGTWT
ncbi:hypothetical protein [Fodinicola feengrottensis]|uniref:Uncharacterized protein n=1 Tax=Fodinicola feengrottensis TaxID=435914 RepID=A0ABN2J7D3_9ACTN|nr:hypothetical protein [Fodinicola feengrottensis]